MTSLGLQTTQIASNQGKSHFIICLVKDSAKIRPQGIFISYFFKLLFIDNKCNFDSEQFYFTNKAKQVCFFNENATFSKNIVKPLHLFCLVQLRRYQFACTFDLRVQIDWERGSDDSVHARVLISERQLTA